MVNLSDSARSSNGYTNKMDDNNINANFGNDPLDNSGPDLNKQNEDNKKVQYTIPGVLHFLQHEWAKFEMDRRHWDVERAEFQARISFLRGERKGQENLKNDLVRRIKMLEYALKQERIKNYKLTHVGAEPNVEDIPQPDEIIEDESAPMDLDAVTAQPNSNLSWRQGRQLLRQYLQEIGYTDTILDVRSFRVKSLLGLTETDSVDGAGKNLETSGKALNSARALAGVETSIMAASEFLKGDIDPSKVPLAEMDDSDSDEEITVLEKKLKLKLGDKNTRNDLALEEQEALGEFEFLSGEDAKQPARTTGEWGVDPKSISRMKEEYKKEQADKHKFDGKKRQDSSDEQQSGIEEKNSVDELMRTYAGMKDEVGLRIAGTAPNSTDDIDPMSCDKNTVDDCGVRKTWTCKVTLRSHYDSIRAMAFHPVEACLLTASEDSTMKLWNLQKANSAEGAKKGANTATELEPVYTFRGHRGAILCLCLSPTGDMCYTGGIDGEIKCWKIPSSCTDMYDPYDPNICTTLSAHTEAVWSVACHSSDNRLITASSDKTVRLWEPGSTTPNLSVLTPTKEGNTPTSVDFVSSDPQQALVAYRQPNAAYLLDLESGTTLLSFDWTSDGEDSSIYQIVSHPTMNMTLTAHADRVIRCFDNNTGKMLEQIVAHLDCVTCLSIDPNGLYLLSGSHDGSLRLWNVDNKTCLQEITAHRRKFDESVLCVAFHPSRPMIASAGADGFAKIFV